MRANILAKLRPPPLVHAWDFWHDRQNRNPDNNNNARIAAEKSPNESDLSAAARLDKYEDRLVQLASVTDVRAFWNVFNNFDIVQLPLRDSIHLFHRGVKPIWEDARNARGGAWTFRVHKEKSQEFWKEICMLAIGEKLQAAVQSDRKTFVDDICGISLSVRFTSILVQIWNRDADHKEGIDRILATVLEKISPELKPKQGSYYYKAHCEHAGFNISQKKRDDERMEDDFEGGGGGSDGMQGIEEKQHAGQQSNESPLRPRVPNIMRDHTNGEVEHTRGEPTMPKTKPSWVHSGQSLPGMKHVATSQQGVPKGSGFISQREAVEDVEESLRSMKQAMDKIEAKDKHIQDSPGENVDTEMKDE